MRRISGVVFPPASRPHYGLVRDERTYVGEHDPDKVPAKAPDVKGIIVLGGKSSSVNATSDQQRAEEGFGPGDAEEQRALPAEVELGRHDGDGRGRDPVVVDDDNERVETVGSQPRVEGRNHTIVTMDVNDDGGGGGVRVGPSMDWGRIDTTRKDGKSERRGWRRETKE